MGHQSRMSFEHDCPSLAIIFLPTYSDISMFEHTLYLPIMTSSPLSLVDFLSSTDYLLEAEQQWEELGVSTHKLTSLSDFSSPVVDQERIERATPGQVQHALKPLTLTPSAKKTATQVSAYAISMYVVSFFIALQRPDVGFQYGSTFDCAGMHSPREYKRAGCL